MSNKVNLTTNQQETFDLGYQLAKQIPMNTCVLISGPLGAGKTQFVKGFCHFFNVPSEEVVSPTYSLHHTYKGTSLIHHFDLYRLNSSHEFMDRGFIDHLDDSFPILVEWPSKVGTSLFQNKNTILLNIEILEDGSRKIEMNHV